MTHPTAAEKEGIPHHLMGFLDFHQRFTALDYREMALERIDDVIRRGKQPIIVGGTGMYFHWLIYEPDFMPEDRGETRRRLENKETEALYGRLLKINPETRISLNDRKRIIRSLEVFELTGQLPKDNIKEKRKSEKYDFKLFSISPEREALYERINKRVNIMLEGGMLQEVKRLQDMDRSLILYNFADNHDVERIYTKLHNKSHFVPVHILLFTLPGIPSVYYGSELGIEGRKEKHSDDSLRPCIPIEAYEEKEKNNPFIELISALCAIRSSEKALFCGEYKELLLTNRQYAFSRSAYGKSVIVAVNNDDNEASLSVSAYGCGSYTGALGGEKYTAADGRLNFTLKGNSGEIFIPDGESLIEYTPVKIEIEDKAEEITKIEAKNEIIPEIKEEKSATEEKLPPAPKDAVISDKAYEEMTVEELQAVILGLLAKNGPVTDRMRKDVAENVYHNSLVNWAKSFR